MIGTWRTTARTVHGVYDGVAPGYAAYRRWWLLLAGASAERRLRRALDLTLRADIRVLDAGAGTGAMSRAVLEREPSARVTMLDRSLGMLAAGSEIPADVTLGDVESLPFRAGTFDVVVAAWVLETVPDPAAAVREMLRVLGPEGRLLTEFSARPRRRLLAWLWRPLERVIGAGFAGRFVRAGEVPFHECASSQRWSAPFAPTGIVVLGRCCLESIAAATAPSVALRSLVP